MRQLGGERGVGRAVGAVCVHRRVGRAAVQAYAYLSALARVAGDDTKVPDGLSKALLDCMGRERINRRPASVQFHLAKFVKRK